MADIIMCDGKGCSRKRFCHRHTAKKNTRMQTFFAEVPTKNTIDPCNFFIRNEV